MSLPSVSVVIPWGKKSSVLRAVKSAQSQSFAPAEIFVIANGPVQKPDIDELVQSLMDDRVKVIHVPGRGNANIARNIGAVASRSEYVAYLDCDDWWDATHLAESLEVIEAQRADFIYSGMKISGHDGSVQYLEAEDYKEFGGMENYLLSYRPAPTPSLVIRRDKLLECLWDVGLNRHQDYDLTARFASRYRVVFKTGVTVNVDWEAPRLHKFHLDCLRVVRGWRSRVESRLYSRHILNLLKSALRSREYRAVGALGFELLGF